MKKVHLINNADFYGRIEVTCFEQPRGTCLSPIVACKKQSGSFSATSNEDEVTCLKCRKVAELDEEDES